MISAILNFSLQNRCQKFWEGSIGTIFLQNGVFASCDLLTVRFDLFEAFSGFCQCQRPRGGASYRRPGLRGVSCDLHTSSDTAQSREELSACEGRREIGRLDDSGRDACLLEVSRTIVATMRTIWRRTKHRIKCSTMISRSPISCISFANAFAWNEEDGNPVKVECNGHCHKNDENESHLQRFVGKHSEMTIFDG